jgi:hypothetical protein
MMWVGFFIAFWCGVMAGMHADDLVSRRARRPGPERALGLCRIDKEWELEFPGDRKVRSQEGIIWYHFPSGEQCDYYDSSWMEKELKRLQLVQKWIGEPL